MRKVGQTLCKQTTPRRLVHNPATPTVRKVAEKPVVERAYVDPMSRAPIAHIPVRIGGVNGYQTPGAIDSDTDVNVMAMFAMKEAKLESRFRSGSPRFTQANGNESVASGWLDTVVGLGNNFELGARFIIKEGIDYDVLLGTTSMRSINGVISVVRNRFEFQLSLTKQWRALPSIGSKRKVAPTRVSEVGSTSLLGGSSMGQEQAREKELCTAHMEDVFGGEQLATALPTGEVKEEGDLDEYARIPDLLSPEDDSDNDDKEIPPRVTRCREPPTTPRYRKTSSPRRHLRSKKTAPTQTPTTTPLD
jgi:hypothetical protein